MTPDQQDLVRQLEYAENQLRQLVHEKDKKFAEVVKLRIKLMDAGVTVL